jgi:hypothetical protein
MEPLFSAFRIIGLNGLLLEDLKKKFEKKIMFLLRALALSSHL